MTQYENVCKYLVMQFELLQQWRQKQLTLNVFLQYPSAASFRFDSLRNEEVKLGSIGLARFL